MECFTVDIFLYDFNNLKLWGLFHDTHSLSCDLENIFYSSKTYVYILHALELSILCQLSQINGWCHLSFISILLYFVFVQLIPEIGVFKSPTLVTDLSFVSFYFYQVLPIIILRLLLFLGAYTFWIVTSPDEFKPLPW